MKISPKTEALLYKVRNWHSYWRAFWLGSYHAVEGSFLRAFGVDGGRALFFGEVDATIHRADGRVISLGCIGKRVVTTAGVNYLRDDFAAGAGSADVSNFKYHDTGTGTTAEAITDTGLVTPTGDARVVGTQDNATAKTYKSVATVSYTTTLAITEHGLFSASTVGTLWDRTKFSAINVQNGDAITFTYTLTISDGG